MCQTIFGNDLYPENILKNNQNFSLMIHMPYLFKIIMYNYFTVVMVDIIMLKLADLGGTPPLPKIFTISCSILGNLAKLYVGVPRGLAPPSFGESWSRP